MLPLPLALTPTCFPCFLQLTCVHLIDSHHCSDPSKFLSVLLLSLNSMTQLELPHVNILSKMDLIESMGPLEFGLDFYTDVLDLSYLLPRLKEVAGGRSHPLARKFARLNKALADLIESYNLVSFLPLAIDDQELLTQVLKVVDKANGFMYLPQVNAESGRGAQGSTTHSPTTATAAPQTAGAKTSPATSAGVAAFAAAASSSNSSKAAVAPSASSTDASAAALRQRSQLLNSVDTSQLHELNLSVYAPPAATAPPGLAPRTDPRGWDRSSLRSLLSPPHVLLRPDIQERYLPRTTQIDAPNAPRAHASATANATAAAVATAAAPPLQIREAKHG